MVGGKPRPFVDTDVLFSGLYSSRGAPATILDLHVQGRPGIVVSRQVLQELIGALQAKKPETLPLLHAFLTAAPPEVCPDPAPEEVRRASSFINETDAPILAAVWSSGADCLVTGDLHHFTPEVARRAKIAIFTPSAYLPALAAQ